MNKNTGFKISNDDIIRYFFYIVAVMLPFLIVAVLLILNGFGIKTSILFPVWNDEVSRWDQINTMIHCGKPLGYYGYNGTHASIGTWGPWGWASLVPYYLFGKLFGWHFNSMAIANMTFLSLSIAVFLALTKPKVKQTLLILFIYISSAITIIYSLTSMAEALHYSLGIVLVGLFIWLERRTRVKLRPLSVFDILLYILLTVFLYYSVLVYTIFALVIPMFFWCFFRRLKPWLKAGISIIATLLIAVSANYFIGLVSSPYTTNTINNIINVIKSDGIYNGICYMLDVFFSNLATLNFPNMIKLEDILFWFFVLYIIILGCLIGTFIHNVKEKTTTDCTDNKLIMDSNNIRCLTAFYLLTGFLCGYCLLYTGGSWTLCRGINTGLLMALFCIIFISTKKVKLIYTILAIWICISSVSVWNKYDTTISERWSVGQYSQSIEEEKNRLENIIIISDDKDAWENTVAQYGNFDYRYLGMPEGAGLNLMVNGKSNEHAGYAAITKGDKNEDSYLKTLTDSGYKHLYEDEFFIILKNSK